MVLLLIAGVSALASVDPILPAAIAGEPGVIARSDATLPPAVRAMIDAAIARGDAGTVAAVVAIARETNPSATAEIDAIDAAWRASLAEKKARDERDRQERLASAHLFDHWTGQVEFGASRSTGTSDSFGLYGALSGDRQGLKWRHKLAARADIQRSADVTTTERMIASWQPNYDIGGRLYAFGLAQYEHDRFLGYDHRYTAGGGLGYGVFAAEGLKLDLEGGPAIRIADPVGEPIRSTLAGRASLDFNWQITPTLQLSQTGSLYLESGDRSASASTALDTKLLGALKARFSYNVQYEKGVNADLTPVDTLSRATLIYSF